VKESTVALSPAELDRKIDEHFTFEARDDVEGVLATLAADAEHDVVGSPFGPTRGREAARAFYVAMFSDLSESKVQTVRRLYGTDFVVDESHWQGRAPGAPFGLQGKNRPVEFRLLHVVEFADTGEIARENVWIDFAAILNQLPQD
jgi:ketosteroid isomerase-like protein